MEHQQQRLDRHDRLTKVINRTTVGSLLVGLVVLVTAGCGSDSTPAARTSPTTAAATSTSSVDVATSVAPTTAAVTPTPQTTIAVTSAPTTAVVATSRPPATVRPTTNPPTTATPTTAANEQPRPLASGDVLQLDVLACTGVCHLTMTVKADRSYHLVRGDGEDTRGVLKPGDVDPVLNAIPGTDFAQLRRDVAGSCPGSDSFFVPEYFQFRQGAVVESVVACGADDGGSRLLASASFLSSEAR